MSRIIPLNGVVEYSLDGQQRSTRTEGYMKLQSGADPGAERQKAAEFTAAMAAMGVAYYRLHYRWIGPVKLAAIKEVGPPPWRLPRLAFTASRARRSVGFTVGWRHTAYRHIAIWRPKR